jgi:hypothetical protein
VADLHAQPEADLVLVCSAAKTNLTTMGGAKDCFSVTGTLLFFWRKVLCHFAVCGIYISKEIGGFRVADEGAQGWDVAMRVIVTASKTLQIS